MEISLDILDSFKQYIIYLFLSFRTKKLGIQNIVDLLEIVFGYIFLGKKFITALSTASGCYGLNKTHTGPEKSRGVTRYHMTWTSIKVIIRASAFKHSSFLSSVALDSCI